MKLRSLHCKSTAACNYFPVSLHYKSNDMIQFFLNPVFSSSRQILGFWFKIVIVQGFGSESESLFLREIKSRAHV
jgi:hypothetical protein